MERPSGIDRAPRLLSRVCAPRSIARGSGLTALFATWITLRIPSIFPHAAAFERRCVWWTKKEVGLSLARTEAAIHVRRHTRVLVGCGDVARYAINAILPIPGLTRAAPLGESK